MATTTRPAVVMLATAMLALAALAWDGGAAPAQAAVGPYLYALMTVDPLPSEHNPPPRSAIEIVDLATNTLVRTIPLGQRTVKSLAVAPDGKRLYVSDERGNGIAVYDGTSGTQIGLVPMWQPRDLILGANGPRLYASGGLDVLAFDTASGTIVLSAAPQPSSTQVDSPFAIALSPDGGTIAVTTGCSTQCNDGVEDGVAVYLFDTNILRQWARVQITDPGQPTNCGVEAWDVAVATDRVLVWDGNCGSLYQVRYGLTPPRAQQDHSATIRMGRSNPSFGSFAAPNALAHDDMLNIVPRAQVYAAYDPYLYVMEPAGVTGQSYGGFTGLPFVSGMTPDKMFVYISVGHLVGQTKTADTLDRVDARGKFGRNLYTFSDPDMWVRDIRIVNALAPQPGV
jgi:hypothetical protein